MKNGKTIFLFVFAIFVIVAIFIGEINFQSIATDSGFGTSYGGGSSSGSSGGSSSSSSSSSSSNDPIASIALFVFWEFGFNSFFYYTIFSGIYRKKRVLDEKLEAKKLVKKRIILLIIINVILLCFFDDYLLGTVFGIDFLGIFVLSILSNHFFKVKINPMSDEEIKEKIPNFDKEEFLSSAYQIYYDIQQAWMNFDYDTMRTLVTDELYNMYYNQLQTLELKNQKNVMSDFELKNSVIADINIENNIETITVKLVVSFYDYIVRNDGIVIRGNKNRKVEMTYLLTFVRSNEKLENCPHCGAKLEGGETVCTYCHATIQSVSHEMKLSKKEVINQK